MNSRADAHDRFDRLVWPHRQTVLRSARLMTRDAFVADDLAQEVMVKAFRSIDRFVEGTDARAWLLRILRNAWIDQVRSRIARKERQAGENELDDTPDQPAQADSNADDWSEPARMLEQFSDVQVIEALQLLPDDIRWTLLLVDVEGLDHAQAATVLDVPVGTVKSRAHRGRSMLRRALEPIAREQGWLARRT